MKIAKLFENNANCKISIMELRLNPLMQKFKQFFICNHSKLRFIKSKELLYIEMLLSYIFEKMNVIVKICIFLL